MEFYKDKRRADGLYVNCKQCHNKRVVTYNKQYQKTTSYKKKQNKNRRGKLECLTRSKTRYLIKKGIIIKLPCEVCGLKEVQAHHDNYNDAFNVRFLCAEHHKEYHNKINKDNEKM